MPWPNELEDQPDTLEADEQLPVQDEEEDFEDEDEEEEQEQPQRPDYQSIRLDGDDIPEPLRGKSVSEAMQQYNSILSHAQQMAQQMRQGQMQQQQQQTPPEPEKPVFEDDDLLGDARNFETKLNQFVQRRVSPYVQQQMQAQTQQARQLAQQQFGDEFQRWGQEIDQLAGQLPVQQTANPQTWAQLVQYVRGQHMDEIIQERIQAAQQQPRKRPPPSERGRAPAQGGRKKQKGEISAEEREVMQLLGIDETTWKAQNG